MFPIDSMIMMMYNIIINMNTMNCSSCGYSWKSRVKSPKSCPLCKRYMNPSQYFSASNPTRDILDVALGPVTPKQDTYSPDKWSDSVFKETVVDPKSIPGVTPATLVFDDEDGNRKPNKWSEKVACRICSKLLWKEFSNNHFMSVHEGSQI